MTGFQCEKIATTVISLLLMFVWCGHKLLAIDDWYRYIHLLPNGRPKILWGWYSHFSVVWIQWSKLHGDKEKFIFRRKKMNQRCKIELNGINRKYSLVSVSFPDPPFIHQEYHCYCLWLPWNPSIEIPYCLIN